MPNESPFTSLTGARVEARSGATWRIAISSGSVNLTLCDDATMRIAFVPAGAPPHRTWSVARPEPDAPPDGASAQDNEHSLTLVTSRLAVTVTLGDLRLDVARPDGSALASIRLGRQGDARAWHSDLIPGERVIAGGQRTRPLDRRGRRLTLWATDPLPDHDDQTDAMYQSIPIAMMLRGERAHGIFFDVTWPATLDLGQSDPGALALATTGPDLVAYVFAGPTLAGALEQYTSVTGRMPPLPRWALGYQQSRWSYASADEARAVAAGMREHDIPCDAIYLDIDYMDGYRDFTWNAATFPDPAGLIGELGAQGIKIVTIIDPGVKVDPAYEVYREGHERGFFVCDAAGDEFQGWVWPGLSAWTDFAREDARDWWAGLHRGLIAAGVAGVWDDMNEPSQSGMSAPPGVTVPFGATLPLDARHGDPPDTVPHVGFHNAYGLEMTRATREGIERARPDARPFVLTRATGAGGQRYAAVWNGDNSSIWPHLALAVTMNLGLGLAGFPMTGCDIGGFWRDTEPELLVRFTQLGALLPFCRNHTARDTDRQEPWAFGEPYTGLCRAAIRLRYQLMPLLVTLAREASVSGAPIMRPLAWRDPTCACDDEFLLGDDLLVAPVLVKGATERVVTLPAGAWLDWQTGALIHGPATLTVPVTLASLPLYQRAGSIVPLAGVTANTSAPQTEPLTLRVALASPGQSARATIWDDDDHPQAAQRGTFADLRATATWDGDSISARLDRAGGGFPLRYPGARASLALPPGTFATAAQSPAGDAWPLTWRWDARHG